jgi:hypothetical protein
MTLTVWEDGSRHSRPADQISARRLRRVLYPQAACSNRGDPITADDDTTYPPARAHEPLADRSSSPTNCAGSATQAQSVGGLTIRARKALQRE